MRADSSVACWGWDIAGQASPPVGGSPPSAPHSAFFNAETREAIDYSRDLTIVNVDGVEVFSDFRRHDERFGHSNQHHVLDWH